MVMSDMREIKVIIDEGGIFQGLYVTLGLEDCDVELIDFVTDDPNKQEDTQRRYDDVLGRAKNGELVGIG